MFLYVLADFGAVQLLRYDTLTRAIYANRLIDPAVAATLSLALGLLAIVVVLAQRALAPSGRDVRRQGRPLIVPLGRWRAAAYAYLVALLGLALAAPLAVLAYWASRGAGDGSDRPTSIVANPERLVEPAVNTSLASGAAALVAVVVVLPVAYLSMRHRGRLGGAADALITGGFALPGLVVALALAFWTLNSPGAFGALYQTLPLLVGAYALHFGALALRAGPVAVDQRAAAPGRRGPHPRPRAASRLATVELPLMAPGLRRRRRPGAAVGDEGAAGDAAAGAGRLPDARDAGVERRGGRLLGRREPRGPRAGGTVGRADLAAGGAPGAGLRVRAPSLRLAMLIVALVAFGAAAAGVGVRAAYDERTTADEPHYLVTAISIAERRRSRRARRVRWRGDYPPFDGRSPCAPGRPDERRPADRAARPAAAGRAGRPDRGSAAGWPRSSRCA